MNVSTTAKFYLTFFIFFLSRSAIKIKKLEKKTETVTTLKQAAWKRKKKNGFSSHPPEIKTYRFC